MMRQDPESHTWTLALPIPTNSPIPLFAPQQDTGKFVKGILLNREKTLGKRVYGATAYYTCDEIVNEFKDVYPEAGKGAKAVEISHDAFKKGMAQTGAPEFVQEEMLQNMRMMPEYGYYGGAKLDESHSVRAPFSVLSSLFVACTSVAGASATASFSGPRLMSCLSVDCRRTLDDLERIHIQGPGVQRSEVIRMRLSSDSIQ
jgi:hypothetical protein